MKAIIMAYDFLEIGISLEWNAPLPKKGDYVDVYDLLETNFAQTPFSLISDKMYRKVVDGVTLPKLKTIGELCLLLYGYDVHSVLFVDYVAGYSHQVIEPGGVTFPSEVTPRIWLVRLS